MALSDTIFENLVPFCLANPESTDQDAINALIGLGLSRDYAVSFLVRLGDVLLSFGYLDEATWPAFCNRVVSIGEVRATEGIQVVHRTMKNEAIVNLIDVSDKRSSVKSSVTFLEQAIAFADTQISSDRDSNRVALFEIARTQLQSRLGGQRGLLNEIDLSIGRLESSLRIA